MSIPKIILQTSKNNNQPPHVLKMIKRRAPDWEYLHFTDSEAISFFINNPLKEFPRIIQKFNSFDSGAHKADLFRYYFIYIKGGVFIDDDAMIQCNINYICGDNAFFSVNSSYCPGCIFQGLIGAVPKNRIIYKALEDAYNTDAHNLKNDYLLLCRNLYNIIFNEKWNFKYKLYNETYGSDAVAIVIDSTNKLIILSHYFKTKVVPNEYFKRTHLLPVKKQKNMTHHGKLIFNQNIHFNA